MQVSLFGFWRSRITPEYRNGDDFAVMRKVFVICEFNPFHYGHEHLLSCAKRDFPDSRLICVMGGSFSQRGEAYVYDKYARAACAVRGGADLVLLLPTVYSSSASHSFALAAVRLCTSFADEGDVLYFGSECGDVSVLYDCIDKLDTISASSSHDCSFIRTRFADYEKKYGSTDILRSPNNILGIEYLRAIKLTRSPLLPFTVRRDPSFASASEIRKHDGDGFFDSIPDYCVGFYSSYSRADMAYGERYILGVLRTLSASECTEYSECGGGVACRLIDSARQSATYSEMMRTAATKRYTNAHLQRAVLAMLMRITKEERFSEPSFTVLLAAKRASLGLLKQTRFKVVTKPSDCRDAKFLREVEFDELYSLFTRKALPSGHSLRCSPYICGT